MRFENRKRKASSSLGASVDPRSLQDYLEYRKGSGLSKATLGLDRAILVPFAREFPAWHEDIRAAMVGYLDMSRKAWTRSTRLRVFKGFIKFLVEEGELPENVDPLRGVTAPLPGKTATAATPEGVSAFLAVLGASWEHRRLAVLVQLLADTGLRKNEACSLRWADYDSAARRVVVRAENAKTRRERTVPVSGDMVRVLRKYRDNLPERLQESEWIFPLSQKDHIPAAAVGRQVNRISHATGVPLRLHSIRHMAATAIIRATGNIALAAQLLGHSQISTTAGFYTHLGLDDVRAAQEQVGTLRSLRAARHG